MADSARGPLLPPALLTPEQRALYDEVVTGPRARDHGPAGPVDGAGRLTGPFNAMLYSPRVGAPLQRLGAALRYESGLADTVRELVILRVAGHHDSWYQRRAHRRIARRLGIGDETLTAVDAGVPAELPPVAAAALELAQRLLDRRLPDDTQFAQLHAELGDAGMFEVNALVGYYSMLATQLAIFGVTGDPEVQP